MSGQTGSNVNLSANDELEMSRRPGSGRPGTGPTGSRSPRPVSASSRNAWNDGIDNHGMHDPEAAYGRQQDDPVAMESDLGYIGDSGGIQPMSEMAERRRPQEHQVVVEESQGCWFKFKRGLRGMWATRQTEDTKTDREAYVRTTLRELIIYILFLVILCVLTFGMTSSTMFYYTKVLSELFLDSQFNETRNNYRGMNQMMDCWRFAWEPMLNGLYWEKWYNGEPVNMTRSNGSFIFYENKILGVPRLRQLRVRSDSCIVHSDFQDDIENCYDAYSLSVEDSAPFGRFEDNNNRTIGNTLVTAWEHHTEDELDGSGHWGLLSQYDGGGYIQNLGVRRADTEALLAYLQDNLYVDRGTRAIFIDFTVYNANINLFCVIRFLMEFPATGGMVPSWTFRTVKLLRYVTTSDYVIAGCEAVFVLFIIYYAIEEFIEIKKHKWSYLKSIWNILDLLVIFLAIVCIAFSLYRTLVVGRTLESLLGGPDTFADFEFLGFWQTQYNNAVAIMVFFAWIKVFKYISFNKTMTQLSSTLSRCAKDIAGFGVMFCIVFFAFAQLGYLIFGTQVKDFSTFGTATMTLIRIILGDFDFHQLEAANRVLGPIYFIFYVFFVFFVLLNMFLAIINDTYAEVKAEIAEQKNEFELTDYFKRGYSKMLSKMNIKKEKIMDIQKALQAADINADQKLDFEEWRQELKARGYADAEIETVFAKYDLDGDRVLDEEEQHHMQQDLEGQKDEIDKDMKDTRADVTAMSGRPKSGRRADSSLDDDESGVSGGSRPSGVSYEEFDVLTRRVDRMEHSIGSIVSKIDAVLVKLEAMEKAKTKRREAMGKILDSINENENSSDAVKREQMERLVREELERWDSETSLPNNSASPREHSPGDIKAANFSDA